MQAHTHTPLLTEAVLWPWESGFQVTNGVLDMCTFFFFEVSQMILMWINLTIISYGQHGKNDQSTKTEQNVCVH